MIIKVSSKWDEEKRRHVPDQYTIEGEGIVMISKEFVDDADPEYFKSVGRAFVLGPYTVEVLYFNGDGTETHHNPNVTPNTYVCRLLTDPESIQFALNTPWEGMGR